MEKSQYTERYEALKRAYKFAVQKLNYEYIERNARFKVGDFVSCVTGIIRIDKITGETPAMSGAFEGLPPTIKYSGLRYKKVKGKLLRTKDPRPGVLADYGDATLELIKVTESPDGELYYKKN